jgi:hypothetical protein
MENAIDGEVGLHFPSLAQVWDIAMKKATLDRMFGDLQLDRGFVPWHCSCNNSGVYQD